MFQQNTRNVLAKLKEVVELPPSGVVAGQAVASLVMEELGIYQGGPINDVDVFLMNGSINCRSRRTLVRTADRRTYEGSTYDPYHQVLRTIVKNHYQVVGTARQGMLNLVGCIPGDAGMLVPERGEALVRRVVGAFDLNCVQVGIDLATEAFWASPAFWQFCRTWELEVVAAYTPLHTAVRFLDKKKTLGCYGNEALAMTTCALPLAITRMFPGMPASQGIAERHGVKVHSRFLAHPQLAAWFTSTPLALEMTSSRVFDTHLVSDRLESIQALVRSVHPLELDSESVARIALAVQTGAPQMAKHLVLAGTAERSRHALVRRACAQPALDHLLPQYLAAPRDVVGTQQLSQAKVTTLARMLQAHGLLRRVLVNKPFAQQLEIAGAINHLVRKFGQAIIGWLEVVPAEVVRNAVSDPQKIVEFIEERIANGNKPLIEPMDRTWLQRAIERVFRVTVTELVSDQQLIEEGHRQRHCVGGYGPLLESGEGRVFSLSDSNGNRSTMALWTRPISLREHRGRGNTPAPMVLDRFAAFWLAAVQPVDSLAIVRSLRKRWCDHTGRAKKELGWCQ